MKITYRNGSNVSNWIVAPLAFALSIIVMAWFTVLPAIGILYVFGWLK